MVRIPEIVLDIAAKKSDEIHHEIRTKKLLRDACDFAGLLKIDKTLLKVTTTSTFESAQQIKPGKRTTAKRESKRALINTQLNK